jgi:putative pyruvate formate lyase activating enzyme
MANPEKIPAYLALHKRGELVRRVDRARELLTECRLCPRQCGVRRLEGAVGACGIGLRARVASYGPHFGEESVLVGESGSGAIFFKGCSLGCVFCQNADISRVKDPGDDHPDACTPSRLADIMLDLQAQGCLNINLVTPTHVVPQILDALVQAADQGLHLPLVYNSSGYDSLQTLQLLDGVVDIYMPDCKFLQPEHARQYTGHRDYPERMKTALREMHAQVGDLVIDAEGRAVRGLLVRHLVMPNCLKDSRLIFAFLAREISRDTFINIMDQYRPCHRAAEFPAINRSLTAQEFARAEDMARAAGLHRFAATDIHRMLELLLGGGKRG